MSLKQQAATDSLIYEGQKCLRIHEGFTTVYEPAAVGLSALGRQVCRQEGVSFMTDCRMITYVLQ